MSRKKQLLQFLVVLLLCSVLYVLPVLAATTQVQIVKYASDGTTVLNATNVTYQWMMANLPVMGDNVTHRYHQGPVFMDNVNDTLEQELRWDSDETTNYDVKGLGALEGTNVKDLCDLVGGMSSGDKVKILSSDGWYMWFAYKNVYQYSSREGPMVLAWHNAAETPDTWEEQGVGYVPDYFMGMRLVWFADTSTNLDGYNVFGNYDWHEAADSEYWYYYWSGSEKYPTTTGLSGKNVNRIFIYSQ